MNEDKNQNGNLHNKNKLNFKKTGFLIGKINKLWKEQKNNSTEFLEQTTQQSSNQSNNTDFNNNNISLQNTELPNIKQNSIHNKKNTPDRNPLSANNPHYTHYNPGQNIKDNKNYSKSSQSFDQVLEGLQYLHQMPKRPPFRSPLAQAGNVDHNQNHSKPGKSLVSPISKRSTQPLADNINNNSNKTTTSSFESSSSNSNSKSSQSFDQVLEGLQYLHQMPKRPPFRSPLAQADNVNNNQSKPGKSLVTPIAKRPTRPLADNINNNQTEQSNSQERSKTWKERVKQQNNNQIQR